MRFSSALLPSLFAASTWAAPGPLCKKGACNADNCLRAARATSASPGPSSATADCSSFMRTTITPCAATSTAYTTVTVTDAPVSVTQTNVVDVTQVNTLYTTITSIVQTIEDTVTIIAPTEVQVTVPIYTAVTVTAANPARRAVNVLPLPSDPIVPAQIQARSVTAQQATTTTAPGTCAATTNAPTRVPAYASACSGTVRYSSACSCAGITGGTTTLSQQTSVTTSTVYTHVTPTAQVTLIATNTVPVTVVASEVVPATFETTDATLVIPSAYTVTDVVVVPTTVVVSPPVCSSYKFVVTDGSRAGQFIGAQDPAGGATTASYGFVFFTDASSAKSFTIRLDGTIYNNAFGLVTRNNALFYILQTSDYAQSQYRLNYPHCSIGSTGSSSYPGAVGSLSCKTDAGTPIFLVACSNTGNNLLQTPNVASAGNGCTAQNIAAVPAC